jgi:hypothetical protein
MKFMQVASKRAAQLFVLSHTFDGCPHLPAAQSDGAQHVEVPLLSPQTFEIGQQYGPPGDSKQTWPVSQHRPIPHVCLPGGHLHCPLTSTSGSRQAQRTPVSQI